MTDVGPPEFGDNPWAGPHPGEPSESDPGFCRCGLGLDAYVHTTSRHYHAVPLTERVWDELRGGS